MDFLRITFSAPDGAPGSDIDVFNPLARAHRNLFKSGQPFERLTACYFNPAPLAFGLRWFGVFAVSSAHRVLFFPGLADRQSLTLRSENKDPIVTHQLEVDHFTLEASRRDWHLTGTGTPVHLGRFPTADLGEGRTLWFTMSIASPDVLRTVQADTEVHAETPSSDTARRVDVAVAAREGVMFHELLFHPTERQRLPAFGHFAVIVGRCGFPEYRGNRLVQMSSPFISLYDPRQQVFWRSHRLRLEPHVDIEIATAVLYGTVSVPVALASAAP